jgi:hypothetical protein
MFWGRWGEKAGISARLFVDMWEYSSTWYADLPYHNFDHALDTLWKTMELADECETSGLAVDRGALIAGDLFHDAGFHLKLDDQDTNGLVDEGDTRGFEKKEDFSASVLGMYMFGQLQNHLQKHKGDTTVAPFEFSSGRLLRAQNAILATTAGSSVNGLEDKILRIADLANVGEDYELFVSNTNKLFKEVGILGSQCEFWEFAIKSANILSSYLDTDLRLTGYDVIAGEANVSPFQIRCAKNIRKLVQDVGYVFNIPFETLASRLTQHSLRMLEIARDA